MNDDDDGGGGGCACVKSEKTVYAFFVFPHPPRLLVTRRLVDGIGICLWSADVLITYDSDADVQTKGYDNNNNNTERKIKSDSLGKRRTEYEYDTITCVGRAVNAAAYKYRLQFGPVTAL